MDAGISPPNRGRGRPTKAETETPQARVARLQSELEAAQAALRGEAQKQAAIVGAAVIARMGKDTGWRSQVVALLRSDVLRKTDRAAIAPLLVGEVGQ